MIGLGTYLKDYLEFEGITQSQFAMQLGITQKHMNRILNNKADISTDLMYAISILADIDINFIANIEHKRKVVEHLNDRFDNEKEIKEYLKEYKTVELEKRGWITFKDKTSVYQKAVDILEFLKFRNFDVLDKSDTILYMKTLDKKELIALWVARCDQLAKNQEVQEYDKSNIQKVVDEINQYVYDYGTIDVSHIQDVMNQNGMYFIIEKGLPSSGIRGAFKIYKGKPAVYISTYQKRVDGLVYSLFHELGHVKSDFNQGKSKVILEGTKEQEERANKFSYTSMVPQPIYDDIVKNYSEKHLLELSQKHKIPMCYMVSQLAINGTYSYTGKMYKKYVTKMEG
jgi:transcriptional regulator with XRE-family HTH domain